MAAEGRNDITLGVLGELPTNNSRKISALNNRNAIALLTESQFNLVDDTTANIKTTGTPFLDEQIGDLETQMTTAEGDIVVLEGEMVTAKNDINGVEALTNTGAWQTPTLLNSWVNQSGTMQYRFVGTALSDRQIHFRGEIDDGASGTVAFELGLLYRPSIQISVTLSVGVFAVNGNTASAIIGTNGDVTIYYNSGSLDPVSFHGVSFWTPT